MLSIKPVLFLNARLLAFGRSSAAENYPPLFFQSNSHDLVPVADTGDTRPAYTRVVGVEISHVSFGWIFMNPECGLSWDGFPCA